MGKRSFGEVLDEILDALDSLHDYPFSIPELADAAGIRYETAKRVLGLLEKIYQRGYLLRVRDRPRMYVWVPKRDLDEVLTYKFFQILMIKEVLSVEDLEREYGLNEEQAEKILKMLVDKGLARWIDEEKIGVLPLTQYLNLTEEDREFIKKIGVKKKSLG